MIASSAQMVADAKAQIDSLDIEAAKNLLGGQEVIFVDIRDVRELDREGRIPGAIHAPRGMLEFWADPNGAYHRKEFSSGKKLVLFCAAGWRSALAAKALHDMGLENVCDLGGGFDAWKKAHCPVETGQKIPKPDNRVADAHETLNRLGHPDKLARQIAFILEIDRLKQIWRQTPLIDYSRKENDAEHSWQLAMMVVVLADYAPAEIDLMRVLKMVLIHDIVEIDAGDTPAFTGVAKAAQAAREQIAADRLFGLLPDETASEFRALWDEFEEVKTPDALFARAMDRLQPFLHNYFTQGKMWIEREISAPQVRARNAIIAQTAPQLFELVNSLIDDAVKKGYLLP